MANLVEQIAAAKSGVESDFISPRDLKICLDAFYKEIENTGTSQGILSILEKRKCITSEQRSFLIQGIDEDEIAGLEIKNRPAIENFLGLRRGGSVTSRSATGIQIKCTHCGAMFKIKQLPKKVSKFKCGKCQKYFIVTEKALLRGSKTGLTAKTEGKIIAQKGGTISLDGAQSKQLANKAREAKNKQQANASQNNQVAEKPKVDEAPPGKKVLKVNIEEMFNEGAMFVGTKFDTPMPAVPQDYDDGYETTEVPSKAAAKPKPKKDSVSSLADEAAMNFGANFNKPKTPEKPKPKKDSIGSLADEAAMNFGANFNKPKTPESHGGTAIPGNNSGMGGGMTISGDSGMGGGMTIPSNDSGMGGGMTISGNDSGMGGGMTISGDSGMGGGMTISGNDSGMGGGMTIPSNDSGMGGGMTISGDSGMGGGMTISGNDSGMGGGMTISGNDSGMGGGMTISGNDSGMGGGMTISGNDSGMGGGMTISGNDSGMGGGMTISGNDSGMGGGMTISGNDSGMGGGMTISGDSGMGGGMTISGDSGMGGGMTISGDSGMGGGMTIPGNDSGMGGGMTISGNSGMGGGMTIPGNNPGMGGGMTISGDSGMGGGMTIPGNNPVTGGGMTIPGNDSGTGGMSIPGHLGSMPNSGEDGQDFSVDGLKMPTSFEIPSNPNDMLNLGFSTTDPDENDGDSMGTMELDPQALKLAMEEKKRREEEERKQKAAAQQAQPLSPQMQEAVNASRSLSLKESAFLVRHAMNFAYIDMEDMKDIVQEQQNCGENFAGVLLQKRYVTVFQYKNLEDNLNKDKVAGRLNKVKLDTNDEIQRFFGLKESKTLIRFSCPHCGTKYKVRINVKGGKFKCGTCKEYFFLKK
ncbi:MJ0042-type zinc finger domain-containing protein [Candidatus Uabimicrobium amorphum]|uniref:MJ0042-type zinc finger domain-containing protein n=1 Tax=Uabimicrobium amorphum TaxID=2596890 RepID=UPI0034A4911F